MPIARWVESGDGWVKDEERGFDAPKRAGDIGAWWKKVCKVYGVSGLSMPRVEVTRGSIVWFLDNGGVVVVDRGTSRFGNWWSREVIK